MALFRNGFRLGGTWTTLAIGAGAVFLAPVVLPMVAGVLRPVAKAAIKGGILAFENAKVAVAETKETFEDIAAEARAEVSSAQKEAAKSAKKKSA
ncbi:MAG: DUF5132 domain-containing protein [Deltaproteobacteria bacterium]|jgi:hypothetical protein|nr:DUF5132 domain-containing protein [Deltaproteobacteria bacterium]MBW2481901.1 DUF5132 domain-containing protein [Deltaproteobacteria bacterium]